jgi:flagellar motor switch/type III secretory pathway protein FliN
MTGALAMRIYLPDASQAVPAPLRLRAVSADTAAAARLRAQVFHARAECGPQQARLTLRSCVAPTDPVWGMTLDTRAGCLLWCAQAPLWQALTGIDPGAGPDRSRLALCQAALALLPERLRALLGEPVVRAIWQTMPPRAPDSSATVWQQLDCRLDEIMLSSQLSATPQCWQTLLTPPWHASPALPWARLAAVPLLLPLVVGELQLTLAQARTLGRGDLLRLAVCRFDSDGSGWLELPACRLAIYWQAPRNTFIFFQFESRSTMQPDHATDHLRPDETADYQDRDVEIELDLQDDEDQNEYGDADSDVEGHRRYRFDDDLADADLIDPDLTASHLADAQATHYDAHDSMAAAPEAVPGLSQIPLTTLEQLPLRLKVVLGEFELTLQALRMLTPGAVLELTQGSHQGIQHGENRRSTQTVPPQVTLEAQGKCLGQGELVTLDGALAVQISTWLDPSPDRLR